MSIEACLAKPTDISISFDTSLRNSIKIPDSRAQHINALKKSQDLTHSRKTMLKNGSSETFETDLPRKTFDKVFDQSQIYGFEAGFCLSRHSNDRWSVQRRSQSRNSRPQTFKKNRKTFSFNNRSCIREASVKTQPSIDHQVMPSIPLNIQKLMKQTKLDRFSLSRSIQAPQAIVTINQMMIKKFISRRKYENSKIVRRDMLPRFLKFSISKCQLHEKVMMNALSSNVFKKHEVFYDTRSYKH